MPHTNELIYRSISVTGVYTSFTEHFTTETGDSQLPDLVNYDEYDAKVFRNSAGHSALKGYRPRSSGFRRIRSAMEMQRMAKSVSKDELSCLRMSSPPRAISSFEDLEISSSSMLTTVSEVVLIESLSNYDGDFDGNENVTKQ